MKENSGPGGEQWSKECHPASGLCGNSVPTNWCAGQQPCYGGGVGIVGEDISKMTAAQIQANPNKFWGTYTEDGNLKLIGVGGLAKAGLQAGDVLTGVFAVGSEPLEMSNEKDRLDILCWRFTKPLVNLTFQRGITSHTGTMKNPAGK
jgi:hypothetical protein